MHLNTKKIAFAGVMLALTEVGIALGSVIETNTLFLLAAASFFVGIVIQEFGLKSGAGFLLAGILLAILLSPNKLYVVSYAFMGFYILIIETIWHFSGRASGWIRSRNFFWLMKYLVFNVLYIPGLIYFWSMLSEKKTAKGIMLMSVVFGQFILFVFDKTYEYAMGKKDLGDAVEWIDVATELSKHTNEKIYYKTDHHWTTLGAFYAFQAAAPSLGITDDMSGKYVSYAVTDSFNGSLASKSGMNLKEKEQIDIYVPTEEDTDLIVDYVDEGKRVTSLYNSSALKEKDKYTVFLGGNYSLLDIRTVSTSKEKLLIVKDSFANSFIPFLTPYYREIVVVDPRYYSGTINDLMDSYRISEVLFLYSGNTFFKDNNISGVFAVE